MWYTWTRLRSAPILLLDGYETARDGLAQADSVAVNAHKWLLAPVDAAGAAPRRAAARDTFSLVPAYLRTDGDEDGPGGPVWFSEYGLEQTRPFRALKVWMSCATWAGTATALIAADLAAASELRRAIAESADLDLLASGLSVVCSGTGPPGRSRPPSTAGLDPAGLDRHNQAVLKAVQLGGRASLAGTTVDGAFALRACIVNPGRTAARVGRPARRDPRPVRGLLSAG